MADRTSDIGFVFSSKNRPEFTKKSLASIDQESGFDLLWVDGSDTPEAQSLLSTFSLQRAHWVEKHGGIKGGPDAAIRFGLERLMTLGYRYCGLIENDLLFESGWFKQLMSLFDPAGKDGFKVGAVTIRNIESRVLSYHPTYTLNWNMGAGMVLFTREAAEAVLEDNAQTSSWAIYDFYKHHMNHDLRDIWELWHDFPDRNLGMDWKYALSLYQRGMVVVGSIPNKVSHLDLDFEEATQSRWVLRAHPDEHPGGLTPAIFDRGSCPACRHKSTRLWSPRSWRLSFSPVYFGLALCSHCGSIFCTPRPMQDQLAKFYQQKYDFKWFKQHLAFKKIQGWHRWRRLKQLFQRYGIHRGRLLEVGCGHGLFASWAKRDGWDVTGIDYPSEATKYAMEKYGLAVAEGDLVSVLQDSTSGLKDFDMVTIWHCLEHVSDPEELLSSLRPRMAPSGKILVAVPNAACAGMRLRREAWVWCQEPYVHTVHFTSLGLQTLLERAGYRSIAIWSRETWDANRLFDVYLKSRVARVANRAARIHPRLRFWVEELGRLTGYLIGGFKHWALGQESSPAEGSELLVLAERKDP